MTRFSKLVCKIDWILPPSAIGVRLLRSRTRFWPLAMDHGWSSLQRGSSLSKLLLYRNIDFFIPPTSGARKPSIISLTWRYSVGHSSPLLRSLGRSFGNLDRCRDIERSRIWQSIWVRRRLGVLSRLQRLPHHRRWRGLSVTLQLITQYYILRHGARWLKWRDYIEAAVSISSTFSFRCRHIHSIHRVKWRHSCLWSRYTIFML